MDGDKKIIPGLEAQLKGLNVGDEKTIYVGPEDAYGPIDPSAIVAFPRTNLDPNIEPEIGMILQVQSDDGKVFP